MNNSQAALIAAAAYIGPRAATESDWDSKDVIELWLAFMSSLNMRDEIRAGQSIEEVGDE